VIKKVVIGSHDHPDDHPNHDAEGDLLTKHPLILVQRSSARLDPCRWASADEVDDRVVVLSTR
jgi:hypothetical protein